MCGIAGIFGARSDSERVLRMNHVQRHRGPDATDIYSDPGKQAVLGHNRLSIIDLSASGRQPMSSASGRFWIVLNGEIYNYVELRNELRDYPYRTRTDTEVILAAFERWGEACLDHLIGMFAFLIWDEQEQQLFAARDRFGVKPLVYHTWADGDLIVASEIKALHAGGVPVERDHVTWSTYLTYGLYDHSDRTFWEGINSLPPGHKLRWQNGEMVISRWYDVAERSGFELDIRPMSNVMEEYLALLKESVRMRFRADVPVGINLSGGLDSSTLFGLVQRVFGFDGDIKVFTFTTGDPEYDELPWVKQMLANTWHPLVVCSLSPNDVPALATAVQEAQDEPFGGLPTLAYARLFERARQEGVIVLLDGQGLDEQWAGYDYYRSATGARETSIIQGTRDKPVRPDCLVTEFRQQGEPLYMPPVFPDRLRELQYRDARYTKLPRALRFNDRISMRASTELREPFLDHRLFELALRQPLGRKILSGSQKWLLREMTKCLLPAGITEAPKRALQTPQREWLRGPLRDWANEMIEHAILVDGGTWLDAPAVRRAWQEFCDGLVDNSFFVWQWISLAMTSNIQRPTTAAASR
jgi:asparagine synthase (glutamine-hydrolysing)